MIDHPAIIRVVVARRRTEFTCPSGGRYKTYKTLLMNNLIWLHNLHCAFSTGSTWHYTGNRRLFNFFSNEGNLETKVCGSGSGSKRVDRIKKQRTSESRDDYKIVGEKVQLWHAEANCSIRMIPPPGNDWLPTVDRLIFQPRSRNKMSKHGILRLKWYRNEMLKYWNI